MGHTLYLGMERGNIACHKSEARFGTLLREGRLASWASRDEAFWRSQVNFGPPNPVTDEKALWNLCSLESYTSNNKRGLTQGFPFITSFMTREPRLHQLKWWKVPPESKGELLHLSPRDRIRYLNRLKESEEMATLPDQPTGKPFLSGYIKCIECPIIKIKEMG
ncbi:hypothetical protein LOK49_LG03G00154 [Camellia lanceoleosa]|uniref:Uncharacterized protein n=1 Tax=Camellia lanceoleosa TaxID=1840588 RepID=A0ACC0IBY2_9ERIC|nr:hypothetical protein LOK49_LG03G00154 [Camellia lanceoleosa]